MVGVVFVVVCFVGFGGVEAIVGADVYYADAACEERGDVIHSHGMGQGDEGEVHFGDGVGAEQCAAHVYAVFERRPDVGDVWALFSARAEVHDVGLGVSEEEVNEVEARVAGGADNADADHDYSPN